MTHDVSVTLHPRWRAHWPEICLGWGYGVFFGILAAAAWWDERRVHVNLTAWQVGLEVMAAVSVVFPLALAVSTRLWTRAVIDQGRVRWRSFRRWKAVTWKNRRDLAFCVVGRGPFKQALLRVGDADQARLDVSLWRESEVRTLMSVGVTVETVEPRKNGGYPRPVIPAAGMRFLSFIVGVSALGVITGLGCFAATVIMG